GIFTNPTFDYEVCFVAGTPVLMADGSRRAIETLRPGDLVLAADQLNPESAPAPAKVVRFFDNGEKTVVRLRFEGQELVCTPEHPFYVLGKGWIRADGLVEGDLCLSAKGESVAFVSREELAEKRRVYNIEVEGAHTYFVGDNDGVLAHNVCQYCHKAIAPHTPHLCVRTESKTVYYRLKDGSSIFLGYLEEGTNNIWKYPPSSKGGNESIELEFAKYFLSWKENTFLQFAKTVKKLYDEQGDLNETMLQPLQPKIFEMLNQHYKQRDKVDFDSWKGRRFTSGTFGINDPAAKRGFLPEGGGTSQTRNLGQNLYKLGAPQSKNPLKVLNNIGKRIHSEAENAESLNELW
ncbi:MAG: hypothetical protein IJL92_09270, partial [Thermoguttaceae bacterium]|nr:hypothetical protein [Thermoguttaceae bacterium]